MDADRIEYIQETICRKLSKPFKPEKGLFCTWVHDRYYDVMALFSSEEIETVDPVLAEALDRFLRDRVWVKAASMQVINETEKLEPVPKRQRHLHRIDLGSMGKFGSAQERQQYSAFDDDFAYLDD